MSKRFSYFLLVIPFCLLLLFSCHDKDGDTDESVANRVILVYLAANNNLVYDAYNSINKMEEAMQYMQADVYVYATLAGSTPKIYKIKGDAGTEIKSTVVKSYSAHNSADPDVMQEVLQTMRSYAGSRPVGLVLWSHATNWLPDNSIKLRSFNEDDGEQTDLKDLEAVLPSGLDFLLFDACSMASVEVLYQLRDKAKYTVASPAEVLSTGMPYDLVLPHLVDPDLEQGLTAAADQYYQYYNSLTGDWQSATITVVDNHYFPALAQVMQQVISDYPVQQIQRDALQRLDFDASSPSAGFDFMDFVTYHFPDAAVAQVQSVMQQLVRYKAHTATFLGQPITTFCGLSCYVPTSANAWVHPYYSSLDWAQQSSFYTLISDQ